MKRKILLVVGIVACLSLVGCGENNSNNPVENTNNNVSTEETNVEVSVQESTPVPTQEVPVINNSYDDDLVFDDEIIEFDDVPNSAPEPDVIVSKIDESAEGLVFAYYQKKDAQLTFGDVLTNYTTDFTTLRKGDKQRRAFLGFKLDDNDRIQRAYACVIYKGVLYALEGTTDGSKNDSNKAIMNRMYEPGEIEDKGYRYSAMKGETHAETYEKGEAHTFYDGGANIDRYGKIYCD